MPIAPDRLVIQQQIYNFLRTVTIKYEPIGHYLNEALVQKGYHVNYEDPLTWKYYLNMVGQYHTSDTPMMVTSLDTRTPILFSPDVLKEHPRTRVAYLPGSSYYKRLCLSYPEQVDLIKSILFPVKDIETAIQADNLSLLGWGSGYLEEWEEPILIEQIYDFLEILKERWYFDFLDDEPYFYLSFWGAVPVYLAMLLMSGRVANVHTPYAHSWDIWHELQANGISNYSDVLNREKTMMLYQNIDYFKVNAGKQSNLIILANRLLADFGIGLYGRMVVQETQTGADKYQLTPQLVPMQLPSDTQALPTSIEIKSVATLQSEIFKKGLTSSESAEKIASVERQLGDTVLNEFATKFLEIRPLEQNKPYAEMLNMFLLETLVVSIKEGYYSVPVEVLDPLTNNPIYLSPSELLALYHYATAKSLGIEEDTIPTKVRLYRSFLPDIKTPAKTIKKADETLYLSQMANAQDFLSSLNYDKHLQTPLEFSTNVTSLWLRFMSHLLADQNTSLSNRDYVYQYLSTLCHTRREETLDLVPGFVSYDAWLGLNGVDLDSVIFSQYKIQADPKIQWANLADAIMTKLIPINNVLAKFGNFTLSDSGYERLRQLFIQMCSYRVVFIQADREISDYALGAKWSTWHGPDQSHNYSDFIMALSSQTVDHTQIDNEMVLHNGVTQHLQTNMVNVSHPVFTHVTKMGSAAVTSYGEQLSTSISTHVSTHSHGLINLDYSPALPIIDL